VTQDAASKIASVIGNNRSKLDSILNQLQTVLNVVNQHQVDLAQTVSYLAGALQGFSSVGYSGPQNTPNTWANIFTIGVGPVSNDPLFGCNAQLSAILTIIVGPDPVTNCSAYTGPVPGGSASGAVVAAPSGAALPLGRTGSIVAPSASATADSLNALLAAVL
jgi:hypothetical protein